MTEQHDDNPQSRNLIWKITEAISDTKVVEPPELDLVLAEHIDIDALEKLSTHQNSTWTLTFELPEQDVTVSSDGTILVDDVQKYNW